MHAKKCTPLQITQKRVAHKKKSESKLKHSDWMANQNTAFTLSTINTVLLTGIATTSNFLALIIYFTFRTRASGYPLLRKISTKR